MSIYDSYSVFKHSVLENLEHYNSKPYGLYPRNGECYPHIVDIPKGQNQLDVIKRILKNDGVDSDLFSSPHQYAHHLNSSQVVCYEFFRPMLCADGHLNERFLQFLEFARIPAIEFTNGYGKFEWVPYPEENTNFDFFIQQTLPVEGVDERVPRVYFEIKYTEQGFGKCNNDARHQEKFKSIYLPMMDRCACLKRKMGEEDFDAFRENYQLFRNSLRITKENWRNEYVVFLFPRENKLALNHFQSFLDEFVHTDFRNHVLGLFWEDLISFMSERFKKKFFFYTE